MFSISNIKLLVLFSLQDKTARIDYFRPPASRLRLMRLFSLGARRVSEGHVLQLSQRGSTHFAAGLYRRLLS